MRRTYRFDKEMDCVVEVRADSNFFVERPQGPNVIRDDMGAGVNGLRAMYRKDGKHFDSKSAYRADVRARGLVELGSDVVKPQRERIDYGSIVKTAHDQWVGDYNGTRDQVKKMGG